MMVGYTAIKKGDGHDFDYFLKRGLFLIVLGAFILPISRFSFRGKQAPF
jgi:hypothetical protein